MAALIACSSATEPASTQLRVTSDGSAMMLENPNDWAIFYLAINPNWLALIDIGPCTDPAICPHVDAHGTARVPYSSIGGYEAGLKSVTLYQWRVRRRLDGEYEMIDRQQADVAIQ